MNIAATQFSLRQRAYEIYVAGCKGNNGTHCEDCHNPRLWSEDIGRDFKDIQGEIKNNINTAGEIISSIRIYGGELLEKSEGEIQEFLDFLLTFKREIWLFTRFKLDEVPSFVLQAVDYIKCGEFDRTNREDTIFYGVTLATSNQIIYKKGVDYFGV